MVSFARAWRSIVHFSEFPEQNTHGKDQILGNNSTAKLDHLSGNGAWNIVHERELLRTKRGVSITEQAIHLPDGTLVPDYLQIKMPSYTTILALTSENLAICIRQYKHGIGDIALTLPGGFIEQDETALETAKRELLEETGFECTHWTDLGGFVIGANQGIGMAHLYLAKNGRKAREPNSGDLEDMEIEFVEIDQLCTALVAGEFPVLSHACTIALAMRQM